MKTLSRQEVQKLLDCLMKRLPKEQCNSCDCLQGFLVQLELDATEEVSDLIKPLRVPTDQMHGCLGCDPCPPGEEYSEYIRSRLGKVE